MGVTFVGGSITSPGMQEVHEHGDKANPLRPLFIADREDGWVEPTMDLLLHHHDVLSALDYTRSGALPAAHAVRNPEMSPQQTFVDMGGHGSATVRVDREGMVTELVCIPRPIERSVEADGGPLRYRIQHEVMRWQPRKAPLMRQMVISGDLAFRSNELPP